MSQEVQNNPNPNEEVDLIKLLNYFKNGIKSIFRGIWKLIEWIIQFIILLRKNWILVVGLVILGAVYGFLKPSLSNSEPTMSYEMVVKTNPISNYELYAISSEINNQFLLGKKSNAKDENLVKELGIYSMEVSPIQNMDDVVNKYYEQISRNAVRSYESDTMFYKDFEVKQFRSNMEDTDYTFQKIKMEVKESSKPKQVQDNFITYINDLPGVKREQQEKLAAVTSLENEIKRNLNKIDTLLATRAAANLVTTSASGDQMLVNTSSRYNVESDLLHYAEIFNKRLYTTQQMKSDVEKGVQVISNLRYVGAEEVWNKPIIKYGLYGFLLACIIVLLIRFNHYLTEFSSRKNLN